MKNVNTMDLSPAVVIGSGLIGASVGCAMTKAGIEVHLEDHNQSHAVVAATIGAGTVAPLAAEHVALVVVAVPPSALADVIAESLERFPRAIVTDVGSVKGTVVADLRRRHLDLSRYVGSHPMAGSQHSGPLTAHADLFVDRTWVLTPHDTSRAQAVLVVQALARICRARILTMGAAHHDEAVAQVSHVPQLLSSLMGGHLLNVPNEHLRLAGQGLRDVVRIAASDPAMWQQIIAANATAIKAELLEIADDLNALLGVLDDPAEVAQFLTRGKKGTELLPGKHGAAPEEFSRVVVVIPDAPGALAALFRDIEAAGVNIEDLDIEHVPDRALGFLSVQVANNRARELSDVMQASGWEVRR